MNAAPSIQAHNILDGLPVVPIAKATTSRDMDALLERGEPTLLKGAIDHWPALAAAAQSPAALDAYLKVREAARRFR